MAAAVLSAVGALAMIRSGMIGCVGRICGLGCVSRLGRVSGLGCVSRLGCVSGLGCVGGLERYYPRRPADRLQPDQP